MREDEQGPADVDALMSRVRAMRGPVDFDAGFADRVMVRVESPRRLLDELQTRFWRLTPLAIAATVVLSTFNLLGTSSGNQPLVDRLLGLSGETVADTYAFDGDLSAWGREP